MNKFNFMTKSITLHDGSDAWTLILTLPLLSPINSNKGRREHYSVIYAHYIFPVTISLSHILTLTMPNFLNGIIHLPFLALSIIIFRDIKMKTWTWTIIKFQCALINTQPINFFIIFKSQITPQNNTTGLWK